MNTLAYATAHTWIL